LATAFTIDFYKPFWGKGADEAKCVRVSKIAFIGFGAMFFVFALCLRNLDNLLWLAFKIIAFTYGPLLGVFIVAIMTDWRVSSAKIVALMLSLTGTTFTLAMIAKWQAGNGGGSFWVGLDATYWRLYVIAGAVFLVAGAYALRDRPAR
jgi:Na+/proline symporter